MEKMEAAKSMESWPEDLVGHPDQIEIHLGARLK